MTCIVGYVDKKKRVVYIGGDSAATDDAEVDIRKDPKVFKNNGMIFGYSGSFRMGQLLRYTLKIPKQKASESAQRFLCTAFVNAVRDCFVDSGALDGSEAPDWSFMLGYRGALYQVYSDFQVAAVSTPYDATGGGRAYAMGAMHVLHPCKLAPEVKIRRALGAAATYVTGVRRPFKIVKLAAE